MKSLLSLWVVWVLGLPQATDTDYLLGRFNPEADARFVRLTPEHTAGSAVGGYLRTETYQAFLHMAEAAQSDGVTLVILSATRNFESQKRIWENKWKGRVVVEGKNLMTILDTESRARLILRYSSMPGSSRHHWGTDMDLNSLDNSYFETGPGRKVYQWLQAHAATYGFCQPYTSKESGRTGYEEEKWHWSYLPLAKGFLQDYVRHIHYSDITGFDGSSTASGIGIIERYVSGVACQ